MHVRKMLPFTQCRSEPSAWEVTTGDDGAVLGRIEEHALRGASRPFYLATARHRVTGRNIRLELSTDLGSDATCSCGSTPTCPSSGNTSAGKGSR